jgi:hypothetical protein
MRNVSTDYVVCIQKNFWWRDSICINSTFYGDTCVLNDISLLTRCRVEGQHLLKWYYCDVNG